jgi:hypothetical protein
MSVDSLAREYLKIGRAITVYYPTIPHNNGPGTLPFVFSVKIGSEESSDNSNTNTLIPKDSLLQKIIITENQIKEILTTSKMNDLPYLRAEWMLENLNAVKYYMKILSSSHSSSENESLQYFGIKLPRHSEIYYQHINHQLDSLLPGNKPVRDKFLDLAKKFEIPENKFDTVIKTIIQESRIRTRSRLNLPANEHLDLIYLKSKSYRGGSSYKGNNRSIFFMNRGYQFNVFIAVDLVCHEGYPGHHVYNLLMDKSRKTKNLIELDYSPDFGPQGFMTEAIASSACRILFPDNELSQYVRKVLLPLAGLDTTDFSLFCKVNALHNTVKYINIDLAMDMIDKKISDEQVIEWGMEYSFFSYDEAINYLKTLKQFRTRIASYSYGADIIINYINSKTSDYKSKCVIYQNLLSNPTTISELIDKTKNN